MWKTIAKNIAIYSVPGVVVGSGVTYAVMRNKQKKAEAAATPAPKQEEKKAA